MHPSIRKNYLHQTWASKEQDFFDAGLKTRVDLENVECLNFAEWRGIDSITKHSGFVVLDRLVPVVIAVICSEEFSTTVTNAGIITDSFKSSYLEIY